MRYETRTCIGTKDRTGRPHFPVGSKHGEVEGRCELAGRCAWYGVHRVVCTLRCVAGVWRASALDTAASTAWHHHMPLRPKLSPEQAPGPHPDSA